ncbi:hypothetical protein [Motiliproteus sp. MSK22-1]|uniref:hypothetical protein n=1 Tax=Motiliproteus sp. MSK22-1 TaxID=1897630 RepID=UPI0009758460|nr:hypothetical protein [Motiliproteus sp. MSK22-1]OMH31726.1 hypothetical protein BGP75_16520 [Motiliproteus sp. MSK22-1]
MTRENRAFLLAPLVMPFAFIFYAFFADISGFNMESGFANYMGLVLAIVIFGLPVVYLFEFFIGYRFYRLLLKKNKINIFSLTIGGILIADIPMFMISLFRGFGSETYSLSTAFPLFSFVGFMIGLTFWFLLNIDRIQKTIRNKFEKPEDK